MSQLVYIPIKAILFDFDGTLVDTKRFYFTLVADYLNADIDELLSLADELTFSKLSSEERNIKWKIVKTVYKVSRAAGFSHIKSMRAVKYVVQNHTKQFKSAKPTKDAVYAIKRLYSHDIKLAIISFSSSEKVHVFLRKYLKGFKYFPKNCVKTAGEFESKELAIVHFLRKFNLTDTPRSCVIVGDLGGDIIAGKNVGITTFGLTTGYSNYKTLKQNSPDGIFENLLEMEKSVHLFLIEEK